MIDGELVDDIGQRVELVRFADKKLGFSERGFRGFFGQDDLLEEKVGSFDSILKFFGFEIVKSVGLDHSLDI